MDRVERGKHNPNHAAREAKRKEATKILETESCSRASFRHAKSAPMDFCFMHACFEKSTRLQISRMSSSFFGHSPFPTNIPAEQLGGHYGKKYTGVVREIASILSVFSDASSIVIAAFWTVCLGVRGLVL